VRGDEDVAREEGFEVYEGECCGVVWKTYRLSQLGGVFWRAWWLWLWWKSYLGGYGEGPEFDELVCKGCHFLVLVFSCLLGRVCC
jgi:hypothetical protein